MNSNVEDDELATEKRARAADYERLQEIIRDKDTEIARLRSALEDEQRQPRYGMHGRPMADGKCPHCGNCEGP